MGEFPLRHELGGHSPPRPALLDPPHPQIPFDFGESQLSQPGLPLGRSARVCRAIARWGRMVARRQAVPVESVTHGGRMHPSSPAMVVRGHRRVSVWSAR